MKDYFKTDFFRVDSMSKSKKVASEHDLNLKIYLKRDYFKILKEKCEDGEENDEEREPKFSTLFFKWKEKKGTFQLKLNLSFIVKVR